MTKTFAPGERVSHQNYGEGVIVAPEADDFVKVFFVDGERRVPVATLAPVLERNARIVRNIEGGEKRWRKAWLCYQSYKLPLMASASILTAAKIDLLPHQVVLTHQVATAHPRRFLVADEVGLGKTIETALILRELLSRGQLKRALMVVPAGLVNNWHRELNEVFNLSFDIFGSEGDVTDRRSNAFARHDFLIASIDTLKRKSRVKRLQKAPRWDLVVFDEAHHLTAYQSGSKVKKTENYKLAEVLREHTRDLVLLSATPHQGDHFRFWMLIQLLNPTLFNNPQEMLENRHRLNSVVFRRTKADACRPDGSTLFARRWVHTESFVMSDEERSFYNALNEYLRDGFALAKRQGSQGRALGFVMTIFQKIAASSFAAVKRTLRRRLLALTIQEGLHYDAELDIENREKSFQEARKLITEEFVLGEDKLSQLEADRILADLKHKLLKKIKEEELALGSSAYATDVVSAAVEDTAAQAVAFALPEERIRIRNLLTKFPQKTETKIQKLIAALGALWRNNSQERIVIFATYLGSVEIVAQEIDTAYPGQGVVVLKGGDHGAKLAAERKFRREKGPKVLICTAAGREGINLQFARILFNFDLPWNPMELEQRIGRIHRYGQRDTAQVYNLVLSDTIEGKIFLLLDDKLKEIAKTLGKLDENGEIAEDLRTQILGQLSEKLNYQNLYSKALDDPELKRTQIEVETAMQNAVQARNVVFELFQDLERFSLEDYKPFADIEDDMQQLIDFVKFAAENQEKQLIAHDKNTWHLIGDSGKTEYSFTPERQISLEQDNLDLLGLDHPLVLRYLQQYRDLAPEEIGICVRSKNEKTRHTFHMVYRNAGRKRRSRFPCDLPRCRFRRQPHSLLGKTAR